VDKPDYSMLAGVLERCMKRRGVRDCDPYDWEKIAETPAGNITNSSSSAAPIPANKPANRPQTSLGQQRPLTETNTVELDALAVTNNQENLEPSASALPTTAIQPQLSEKRSPLGVAQLPDGEKVPTVLNGEAGATPDKSPKKRKLEGAEGLEAPPLSSADVQAVNTPEENNLNTTGFTPLAASASMPAVSMRPLTPSQSVPQTPSDATTDPPGGGSLTPLNTQLDRSGGGGGGGVRGRTNLRRFHSMNSGNHHGNSPGGSSRINSRIIARDKEALKEQRERDRDASYTQCAMADDDNVSALQQMTRAGGGNLFLNFNSYLNNNLNLKKIGLTLASQWKSQFDDSEETDDELQGEHLQSPEHHAHLPAQLASLGFAMQMHFGTGGGSSAPPSPTGLAGDPSNNAATLPRRSNRPPERLASREDDSSPINNKEVEPGLPRTWSNPQLSPHIRPGLEPPRLQQASFDDCVYAVDVMRNVAAKSPQQPEDITNIIESTGPERKFSLPARVLCTQTTTAVQQDSTAPNKVIEEEETTNNTTKEGSPEEQAVAGRLEIRMLEKPQGELGGCLPPPPPPEEVNKEPVTCKSPQRRIGTVIPRHPAG